jgi:HEPN domain-containing protein
LRGKGGGNDLDLLIVLDDRRHSIREAGPILYKCLKTYYRRFSVDPSVVSLAQVKEHYSKGSPFLNLVSREGKVLYMKEMVDEWRRQAEEELSMAEYLLQGGYLKGACYHAQQSIEKAIKAKLFRKGWQLEKTHSVQRLAAIAKDYKVRISLTDDEIILIDNIYQGIFLIEAGLLPLGDPSVNDAEKSVDIARKLFKGV